MSWFRAPIAAGAMTLLVLAGCGSEEPAGDAPATGSSTESTGSEGAPASGKGSGSPSAGQTPVAEIDPDTLSETGSIEILQYQVAFIGSGNLGKGTLVYGGQRHPFRIGGLGFGGIGVASIDATGTVYNLRSLDDFTGVYGNARLGATAADAGRGRLWLKNPNGVVIKLWSDMEGLALTGGVDGIAISWESEVQEAVRDTREGTEKAWDATKEGTKEAWDKVKRPFE